VSLADPIDYATTTAILERMVGSLVHVEAMALPDEHELVGFLNVYGVLGPLQVGSAQAADGDEWAFASFPLEGGPAPFPTGAGMPWSGTTFHLSAREFISAWRGMDDEVVTIVLGRVINGQVVATIKLTVSRQGPQTSR
jgi:hypothetical protein